MPGGRDRRGGRTAGQTVGLALGVGLGGRCVARGVVSGIRGRRLRRLHDHALRDEVPALPSLGPDDDVGVGRDVGEGDLVERHRRDGGCPASSSSLTSVTARTSVSSSALTVAVSPVASV